MTTAQEWIDKGVYRVKDVRTVRRILKPGETCSKKQYNEITRAVAKAGALIIPFKEHPEVHKILTGE